MMPNQIPFHQTEGPHFQSSAPSPSVFLAIIVATIKHTIRELNFYRRFRLI